MRLNHRYPELLRNPTLSHILQGCGRRYTNHKTEEMIDFFSIELRIIGTKDGTSLAISLFIDFYYPRLKNSKKK